MFILGTNSHRKGESSQEIAVGDLTILLKT